MLAVDSFCLAILAEVKIMTDWAHITNANNWAYVATVTNKLVWLFCLFNLLFLEIIIEKSSKLSGAVFSDFLTNHLAYFLQSFGAKNACSIALSARQTIFIDLSAATLKAIYLLLHCFFVSFFAVGNQNLAVSISVDLVNNRLISLVNELDGWNSIASNFRSFYFYLATSCDKLLASVSVCVYENNILSKSRWIGFIDQVAHIGSHVYYFFVHHVVANCHFMHQWLGFRRHMEGLA